MFPAKALNLYGSMKASLMTRLRDNYMVNAFGKCKPRANQNGAKNNFMLDDAEDRLAVSLSLKLMNRILRNALV